MAMCCLMRGSVGEVAKTEDGAGLMLEMINDCAAAATAAGHPQRPRHVEFANKALTDPASPNAPSMLRDLRQGFQVEAQHVVGDMLKRCRPQVAAPRRCCAPPTPTCRCIRPPGADAADRAGAARGGDPTVAPTATAATTA